GGTRQRVVARASVHPGPAARPRGAASVRRPRLRPGTERRGDAVLVTRLSGPRVYAVGGTFMDAASGLFALTDRELWLVTARAGERRGGLIATFASDASIGPEFPRVAVGL